MADTTTIPGVTIALDTDLQDRDAIRMEPGVQYPISSDGRWSVLVPAPAEPDVIAIDKQINDAISALHARTPRANARRIVNGTYSVLLSDALKLRRPGDETLTLRENGGYVANSAKFPGEADYLEVAVNLVTGAADVKCYRARSQCRPNGTGPKIVIRMHGRIVFRS